MATTTKTRTQNTIRELLTKAEDPAVDAQEAQTLSVQAARVALDESAERATTAQKPEATRRLDYTVSGQAYHGKARAALVLSVAAAYGCEVSATGNVFNGKDRTVHITGATSALDTLSFLLSSLMRQAEIHGKVATKVHMAEVRDNFDTSANRNIERRNFYRAYLSHYGQDVAALISTARAEISSTASAPTKISKTTTRTRTTKPKTSTRTSRASSGTTTQPTKRTRTATKTTAK